MPGTINGRMGTNMKMSTIRWPGIYVVLAILLAVGFQLAWHEPVTAANDITPSFVPGQLIIRFHPGVTQEQIDALYKEYGLSQMDNLDRSPNGADQPVRLAFVPVEVNQSFIDTLARDPRVLYAEPNYVVRINKTPNDPDFSKLWGLNNTGQTGGTPGADIGAVKAWDISTGSSSVVVGLIDTGIDYTHEDLTKNIWVNPGECPGGYGTCQANGKDDDNDGYVDDFYGINAITNSGDPMDDYGHGTHVAGTIGAMGDNSTGVTGVNWTVKIVTCKFLSASGGGTIADAVKCFNYMNYLKNKAGVNIVATNNSWGGGGESQTLKDAMAGPDQPLHICAAGNSGTDQPQFPAGYDLDNIISVAATDHNDLYADFSNYGNTVDLAAPGVDIYSTVPKGSCTLCDPSGYALLSGTSMATPHVTGAAALIASKYPSLTRAQIKQRIVSGVDPLADTSKPTLTNGRLNVFNTLEDDTKPPAAVNDLAVTGLLLTQVNLSWTATGDDGLTGTATSYDIRYSKSPISPDNWDSAAQAMSEPKPQAAGSTEKYTLAGLEPNTTYYIAMKVVDNVGNASDLSNVLIAQTSAGTIVFSDDMESGPGKWTTAGTDDLWHLSELRANSPTHSWYYGDDTKRNYDTGGANSGTLTSPDVDLTENADVLLTFYEWSEVESSPAYDRTRVQVSTDGKQWKTVFESHGTDGAWVKRSVSLTPFVGESKTIQVRFWFDTVDNRFNSFEGWYVDDVQVLVAKPTVPGKGLDQPNLVMQESNIGFSNPAPVAGDTVTAYAVVLNNGAAEANDVQVQFMDVTGDNSMPIGSPQTIANIPVAGSATAQVSYETSASGSGTRKIQVVVDPYNLIAESNEADNTAQQAITVTAKAAPNLTIKSDNIGFNPAQPKPGDQVTVNAVIMNNGSVEANNIAVQFMDVTDSEASTPIGSAQTIDLLKPGQSGTVQVTYDTTGKSGERKIQVLVDPQNTIVETDKSDNDAKATLSLAEPSLPNLTIDSANIGFYPAEPVAGQLVTIAATIFNEGHVAATGVTVEFVDVTDGGSISIGEPQTIASVPPGASSVAQVQYDTHGMGGDRKIQVVIDPHNYIAETKKYDNDAKATLTVTPSSAPNLVMMSKNIGLYPAQPTQGEPVTVTAVVLNNGTAAADDVTVQFLDATNGAVIPIGDKQTLVSIPAGGSAVAQVSYDTAQLLGDRSIQVVVDPNNYIAESNEEDNSALKALTVASVPKPNLTMLAANIGFDPALPTQGDLVTVTAVVLNNGSARADHALVQFVDVTNGGFNPIGKEQFVETVPVGGSAMAQAVYDTSGKAGRRKIEVLVDSNNLIAETDETDNDAVATLNVHPSPIANLVVEPSGIGFDPLHPTEGTPVTVTVTVYNRGDAAAKQVVVQLLDFSLGEGKPVGEPQTIDTIAAGGSGVAQFRYDTTATKGLPAGDRILRVVADPSNFIPESDETDNRATTSLTVEPAQQPNLVVEAANIGFSPSQPVQGEPVTITVTVLNNGSVDAQDVLVQFVDVTGGGAEPIGAKQTIPAVLAGKSGIAQVIYDTVGKAGERRIRVVADPHMIIRETSESDNEAVTSLVVQPPALPNLVISENNIGFSATNPDMGAVVTVTATILNNGNADAQDVAVQFMDATDPSPTPIGTDQVISSIPAGGGATAQIAYDTTGKPGKRKIQVVVDPNNLIVEVSENDNRAVATLSVQSPPLANLVIKSDYIGFSPSEPSAGDMVAIFATVHNDGSAPVSNVTVQFLDVTGGGSILIGDPQVIGSIGPGSSGVVQVSYTMTTPDNQAATDRKIQVVVDPNNTIIESDKSDNSATATLAAAKTPMANLTVSSGNVTFDNASPVAGDKVTVYAVILNTGATDASNVVVQFVDDTDMDAVPIGPQQVIPTIVAGGSATVQVVFDTTGLAGDRKVKVTADPNNFIPESDESDNSASATLSVTQAAKPNLVVLPGNVVFSPPAPVEGDPVTLHAVILNHGAAEARDVVVQFMDATGGSLEPIETPQTIARIPAGSGVPVQVTYATTGKTGDRTIQVIADPNNFIDESDETDNKANKPLTISPPPAPNLVALAGNIQFDPAKPKDGDLVTINASITNNGSAVANDVVVRFVDVTDGSPVLIGKQRLIDAILPGENGSAQVTYDTTDKAGDRKLQMIVDPNNTIAETKENDNIATVILTVAPPPAPNLVVKAENIKFSPTAPSAGTKVSVTVTVLNDGSVDANKVEVKFVDVTNGSTTQIGSLQTIATIPGGGSGTAQVVYDTTGKEGERDIQVIADPNNLISEINEADNQANATLTVAPPSKTPPSMPNLVVTSGGITFDPSSPTAGAPVTVTVTVSNTGDASASNVVVRFIDVTAGGSDQIGTDQTITHIAAGGSGTASVTYDTTGKSGDRMIKVLADPDNKIPESDETDNDGTTTLTVAPSSTTQSGRPNLVVRSGQIQVDPAAPVAGDVVRVAVVISNDGKAPARNVDVRLRDVTNGKDTVIGAPQQLPYIAPGGSAQVDVPFDTAGQAGTRKLEVVADPDNRIRETTKEDNMADTSINVLAAGTSGQTVAPQSPGQTAGK